MTEQNQRFTFREFLVRPYVRLGKIIVYVIIALTLLITFTVFGYRGRNEPLAPIPQTVVEHPYAVPILSILMIGSIAGLFLVHRFRDIYSNRWIEIDGHILKIQVNNEIKTINLRTARLASFRIMPMFQVLFNNQFHRIGHLRVISKEASYSFYFPVRNDYIAEELGKVIFGKG